ncbi:MAG: trans-sulfuration enzyme family protein [Flavobacteriales bacterium]
MAHRETTAPFIGHNPADHEGSIKTPIYPTSAFKFSSAEEGAAHMETAYGVPGGASPTSPNAIYSRLSNPTLTAAEQRLAAWDESEDAAFFASGMAAITTTLLAWTNAERPLWFCPPLYGGSEHFIREILPGMGVHVVEIDHLDHLDAVLEREGGRKPGMIYLETPANPTMQIHRIRTAADWARHHETEDHRMIVAVDNTYLGPILQRPLEHGADVLVYSATKYIGGHSDLIAGAASGQADAVRRIREYRHFLGGMADPNTCWMLMRSMETLAIRVRHQQNVAEYVFAHLRQHPKVQRFISAWPVDLPEADRPVAAEQMNGGGAMAAFEVAGGRAAAFRVLNAFKHFQLAVSLGSTESLAEHPASMTHAGVPPEVKARFGITEGLIRISVGIERAEDLIADLDQALAHV